MLVCGFKRFYEAKYEFQLSFHAVALDCPFADRVILPFPWRSLAAKCDLKRSAIDHFLADPMLLNTYFCFKAVLG